MKILVTGSREWSDVKTIVETLERFDSGTIIIHGQCRGADVTCDVVAKSLNFMVRAYPANWNKYHKGAGIIRNQSMLDIEHTIDEPIDVCLAFHDDIKNSRGTYDMLKRTKKANIPTKLITSHSPITMFDT